MNLKKAMMRNHAAMVRNDQERQAAAQRVRQEMEAKTAAALEPIRIAMFVQGVRVLEVTRNIP